MDQILKERKIHNYVSYHIYVILVVVEDTSPHCTLIYLINIQYKSYTTMYYFIV